MDKMRIGPKAVERMNPTECERFDNECLMELRTIVYADWLIRHYPNAKP